MRASLLFGVAGAALMFMGATGAARAQDADPPADNTTQARLEESVDGEISPAGDGDRYRLHVEQGMRYRINLDAVSAEEGEALDPTLTIYDHNGNQLAFNDDAGGSLNAALNYVPSSTTDVFVEARGFVDESVGRYQLRVEASTAPPDDAGNGVDTRSRITAGQPFAGALDYEGDVDWFRFRVRTGQRYRIALNGADGDGSLNDPLLRLLDREGNEITSNDDSDGSLNSLLDYVPQRSGEVFIEAGGFGGEQTGRYTLSIIGEPLPIDAASANVYTRGRLALGQSVTSDLGFPSDSDWYRIRLTEGETYRFRLHSDGDPALADPLLRVRDARGEELAMDDDGGGGLNSNLEFTAPTSGNFFVEARGFGDDATGGYTLSAAAGDIPADASTDASLSADGDYRDGMLSPSGDRDWYRVDLTEGAAMRLSLSSTQGEDSLGDPLMVVYGPDGAEIARDDDGGDGLNSYLEVQAGAAGAYYVEARGFSDDATGRYALSLTAGEIGADANGAEAITPNGEGRSSVIGAAGDVDWFSVELVEGRPYRFYLDSAESGALADPMLTLYDSNGEQVAADDDGGRGLNSYITFASITGGVYYAAASAFGEGGGAGRYTLRVVDTDVPGNVNTDEQLDAASDQRMSRIDMPGDLDNYSVELEAGVTYEIEVGGTGDNPVADPFLAVLDSSGERVTSDDDSGDGFDARLRFTPESSGLFLIQASGLGGSTGWYQVTIARREAQAAGATRRRR